MPCDSSAGVPCDCSARVAEIPLPSLIAGTTWNGEKVNLGAGGSMRRVCPYALRVVAYVINKLNAIPGAANWLALRISYGMNGIILKSADLSSLAAYIRWGSPWSIASQFPRLYCFPGHDFYNCNHLHLFHTVDLVCILSSMYSSVFNLFWNSLFIYVASIKSSINQTIMIYANMAIICLSKCCFLFTTGGHFTEMHFILLLP